jgi:hypothetical protein
MADLDFLIGEEAVARSRSSSTYSLSYPIRNGQVRTATHGTASLNRNVRVLLCVIFS